MNKLQSEVGKVDAIWRYAVKSMKGEMLKSADIVEQGMLGDRAFALIDKDTGKINIHENDEIIKESMVTRLGSVIHPSIISLPST